MHLNGNYFESTNTLIFENTMQSNCEEVSDLHETISNMNFSQIVNKQLRVHTFWNETKPVFQISLSMTLLTSEMLKYFVKCDHFFRPFISQSTSFFFFLKLYLFHCSILFRKQSETGIYFQSLATNKRIVRYPFQKLRLYLQICLAGAKHN